MFMDPAEEPFLDCCSRTHRRLIAGRCAWCGAEIIEGETASAWLERTLQQERDEKDKQIELASAIAIVDHHEDELPILVNLLDSEDPGIRQAAAAAIGRMGPTAKDAIDDLARLLKDQVPTVRTAAKDAICAIAKPSPDKVSGIGLDRGEGGADLQVDGCVGPGDRGAGGEQISRETKNTLQDNETNCSQDEQGTKPPTEDAGPPNQK